jgi:hypothetical protein
MSLRGEYEENHSFSEHSCEDEDQADIEQLTHKRRVRKMLEDRLERKRLKEELDDELDGEFDWDELDR